MGPLSWEIEPILASAKVGRCFSPTNIALAKYWGKRDISLNLPANGSISITLRDLGTYTTVEFDASFDRDRLILGGKPQEGSKLEKAVKALDLVRSLAGVTMRARVQSENNFPTGAGLASSASGMSALVFAAAQALGLGLSRTKLSELSRRASGSASRSLFGGFSEWARGEKEDGSDSVAHGLKDASHWPLSVFVAVTSAAEKKHASTGGMEHTRETSPYYDAWVKSAQASLPKFREAIASKDFTALASLSEANCMRFHTSAMAADPAIIYWSGATLELVHRVRMLRDQGIPVFFTIDAGPNVVVVFDAASVDAKAQREKIRATLLAVAGTTIIETQLGEGTREF